jgi:hypothetical protein
VYLRVEPPAVVRVLTATLLACAAALGCGQDRSAGGQVDIAWSVASAPSTASDTAATITLRDPSGRPLSGARLRLEAQMDHPGMAAVVVPFVERTAGTYVASLQFSMAGDWILVASGELADGHRLTSQFAVAGVKGAQ